MTINYYLFKCLLPISLGKKKCLSVGIGNYALTYFGFTRFILQYIMSLFLKRHASAQMSVMASTLTLKSVSQLRDK